MSDWQVGDLALCVDDGPCGCGYCCGSPSGLVEGKAYTVLAVCPVDPVDDPLRTWLSLVVDSPPLPTWEHPEEGFSARRFRKIRPDEHEACENEFVILLKLSKQRAASPLDMPVGWNRAGWSRIEL